MTLRKTEKPVSHLFETASLRYKGVLQIQPPFVSEPEQKNSNNIQTLQLSEDLTEWAILQLWMEERLELTLFWYKPSCFIT